MKKEISSSGEEGVEEELDCTLEREEGEKERDGEREEIRLMKREKFLLFLRLFLFLFSLFSLFSFQRFPLNKESLKE